MQIPEVLNLDGTQWCCNGKKIKGETNILEDQFVLCYEGRSMKYKYLIKLLMKNFRGKKRDAL